jgi:hypothetical protein
MAEGKIEINENFIDHVVSLHKDDTEFIAAISEYLEKLGYTEETGWMRE